MCFIPGLDPITMMAVGISAAGSLSQGMAQSQAAKANAAALETAATNREQKANYEEEQAERRFRRQQGTVQNQIGSSGVSFASFLDVISDDAAESSLEKKAIRVSAEADANNLRFQAAGQRAQAGSGMLGAIINVASGVVGGIGQSQKIAAINNKVDTRSGVSLNNSFW